MSPHIQQIRLLTQERSWRTVQVTGEGPGASFIRRQNTILQTFARCSINRFRAKYILDQCYEAERVLSVHHITQHKLGSFHTPRKPTNRSSRHTFAAGNDFPICIYIYFFLYLRNEKLGEVRGRQHSFAPLVPLIKLHHQSLPLEQLDETDESLKRQLPVASVREKQPVQHVCRQRSSLEEGYIRKDRARAAASSRRILHPQVRSAKGNTRHSIPWELLAARARGCFAGELRIPNHAFCFCSKRHSGR